MTSLDIHLKTLTPLWTGGVSQTCDRLHESGLIGSLRWGYEILVRGLGMYVCDPTSDDPETRCSFNSEAYQMAKSNGCSEEESLNRGLSTVCPVCYLFGTTGWARLFRLQVVESQTISLHFRSTFKLNLNWLSRIFDNGDVTYGNISLQLSFRRGYENYARRQIALIFHLIANYGGFGARTQHGFGQITFPKEFGDINLSQSIQELKSHVQGGNLRSTGTKIDTPFDLQNFIWLYYELPISSLTPFLKEDTHWGKPEKKKEMRYIPCVFDLRYKGKGNFGMRKWLREKGWKESQKLKQLDDLDHLLGSRSQMKIDEDLRTAGRVFFSMPYKKDNNTYAMRMWAFWPRELQHKLPDPNALLELCKAYMVHAFKDIKLISTGSGRDILDRIISEGGSK